MIPPRPTRPGPAPLLAARGKARAGSAQGGLSGALLFVLSYMAPVACVAAVGAHLLFAVEEHSYAVRLLTAVPVVLLILESQHFLLKQPGELPFVPFALLQYYGVFAFGVFFDLKFFETWTPVSFTPEARLSGAIAVALGAVAISLSSRIGRRIGGDIEPWALRSMPPAELPDQWDTALYAYVGAALVVSMAITLFPGSVPLDLGQIILYGLPLELAIGLAVAAPPRRLGSVLAQAVVVIAILIGLLRGSLDFAFRGAISFAAGTWATTRKAPLRLAAGLLAIYVIVQPIKGAYRNQVWGSREVGVVERVNAWSRAFDATERERGDGGMARLSELGAVMHAFDVVPRRVEFLYGSGLTPIFYSPIPRLIWPDKPMTRDTVQRYAVIFGRQTEVGARTTAINLPLLVEGYWNLGWPGIALVCSALGFWLGMSHRLFASKHWAMRATGMANLSIVTVAGPVVYLYSSVFQLVSSRLAVCWGLYWLAKLLSRRRQPARSTVGVRRLAPRP